jgi:hypothetical protein
MASKTQGNQQGKATNGSQPGKLGPHYTVRASITKATGLNTVAQCKAARITLTPQQVQNGAWVLPNGQLCPKQNKSGGGTLVQFVKFSQTNCVANGYSVGQFVRYTGGDRAILPPICPAMQIYYAGNTRYLQAGWQAGLQAHLQQVAQAQAQQNAQ